MLTSDPNASVVTTQAPTRIQVLFGGHLLADSGDVLVLREADREPVYFFPRKDIEMSVLQTSDKRTTTAFGEAQHYTIMRDRQIIDDIGWTYDRPVRGRSDLFDRIAFHPEYVDFHVTETPADIAAEASSFEQDNAIHDTNSPGNDPAAADVDEVIKHTDSGSGLSQEAAWEPTVSEPAQPNPDRPYSGTGSI